MSEGKMSLAELPGLVGQEVGVSSWVTLDQQKIQEFAHCTGDHQWIHVDQERAARESPFGGTVAHGFLTLSVLAPTALEVMLARVAPRSVVIYAIEKIRFMAPVRSGKRVRNRVKLVAAQDKGNNRYLVTTRNTMEIEDEIKAALVGNTVAVFIG
ncbi:MAG: MaoC family dehydratase [Proteobacteria bacterium]|nr:MaoC family dehydratase [Pseudomonadota bacterium]